MLHLLFRLKRLKWGRQLKKCGLSVKFWKSVVIHSPECVSIGDNTGIGDFVVIWGGGNVKIGNNVLIATHSVITSQGHDVHAYIFRESNIMGEIIIEDNVWLGAGVIVLPNVTIGKNSIIAAGSIVSKSIPPNSIALGSPAKVISQRKLNTDD